MGRMLCRCEDFVLGDGWMMRWDGEREGECTIAQLWLVVQVFVHQLGLASCEGGLVGVCLVDVVLGAVLRHVAHAGWSFAAGAFAACAVAGC